MSKDELIKLLRRLLEELYGEVKGECPRLLDEDRGGNGRLDIEIKNTLEETKDC